MLQIFDPFFFFFFLKLELGSASNVILVFVWFNGFKTLDLKNINKCFGKTDKKDCFLSIENAVQFLK